MRKLILSLMLATTAALPSLAAAQENHGHDGGRPAPHQPAPRAAPQPPHQAPQQVQQPRRAAFNGSFRGPQAQFQGRPQQAYQPAVPRQQAAAAQWQGRQAYAGQQHQAFAQAPRQFAQTDAHYQLGQGDHRGQFQGGDQRGQFRGDDHRGQGQADHRDGGWQGDRRDGGHDGGWHRDWRQDSRYDFDRYRYQNRNIFHLQAYYAPYGWGYGYQRFGIGFELYPQLWAEDYWIGDPYYYHLPPADGPYRWVRYYNDALLVDIRSGYVVDAVYGVFW